MRGLLFELSKEAVAIPALQLHIKMYFQSTAPSSHFGKQCLSRVKYIGGAQHEHRRRELLGGFGGMLPPPPEDFYI